MATETPVISTIDFNLSDRCNLRCAFCYTKDGHGNGPDMERTKRILTWYYDQLRVGIEKNPQRRKVASLNIYGGEPLMEWDSLQETVAWIQENHGDLQLKAGVVTNMVLLDEKKLDWLMDNRIGIHPSIDGCAAAEDTHRVFPDGSGASKFVYDNARRLISRTKGRSCRMTISPETVPHIFESIKFLCEDIGFHTVNAILAGGAEWTPSNLDAVKAQTIQVTDWWLEKMREGEHYSLYYLRNMFKGIQDSKRRRSLCSSGISRVGVDTNGDLWPCHRFCNQSAQSEYKLGTIETGFTNLVLYEKLKNYDIAASMSEKCSTCPAVMGCHALCLHEMMVAERGMFTPNNHYCYIWPFYWNEAMRAHSIMTAERNKLYEKMYCSGDDNRRPQSRQRPARQNQGSRPTMMERMEKLEGEVSGIKSCGACSCTPPK